MMTNLLHGAHVANKLFSTIARLRLLLVMFLTLTVSANAWGASIEINYGSSTTGWTIKDKEWSTKYWGLCNQTTYCIVSPTFDDLSVITSVKVTTRTYGNTSNNSNKIGVYANATRIGTQQTATTTFTEYTFTPNDLSGKGAITIQSDGTATGAGLRVTKVTIEYNDSPKDPCTITYEASLGNPDKTSEETTSSVTLPNISSIDCGDWEFAGWATASIEITNETPNPLYVAGSTYTPSSDITLYAVYQRTETTQGSGTEVTIIPNSLSNNTISHNQPSYTITTAKNTGQTEPAYVDNGADIRIYAKGSITISNTTNITKIVFNISTQGKKRLAPITASVGSIATQASGDETVTWTGEAKSVTFTVGDNAQYGTENTKAGQLCFTTITATTTGGGSTTTTYYHSTPDCGSKEPTVSTYTVNHYKQNLDGTYPQEPTATESGEKNVDSQYTPQPKAWVGFELDGTNKTITIDADPANNIVNYYYVRQSYKLTWDVNGGTITEPGTSAGDVKYETQLTAPTVTKSGYRFTSWHDGTSNVTFPKTMPASDKTFTAQWTRVYTITLNSVQNGTISTNKTTAAAGEIVTLTATPHDGYRFGSWTVKDAIGNTIAMEVSNSNTFKMPESDVTVSATFNKPVLSFVTQPDDPIEFDAVNCGSNTPKANAKQVEVKGENLVGNVSVEVTGPYKIAKTDANIQDYTTTLELEYTQNGAINANHDLIRIISCPPAGTSNPTTGTLTFTTKNGNILTVYLSTPTVNCAEYTIKWMVNGVVHASQTALRGTVINVPENPSNDICDGKKFVGWTTTRINEPQDDAPAFISEFGTITSNQTYYAVFATEGDGGGGEVTYTKVTTISKGTYLMATITEDNWLTKSTLAYTGDNGTGKRGGVIAVTISNNIITTKPASAKEITVQLGTGNNAGYFSMYDGTSYITQTTKNEFNFANSISYDWSLNANGQIKQKDIYDNKDDIRIYMSNGNSGQQTEHFQPLAAKTEGNNNGTYYYHAYLFKKSSISSETTYSGYITNCTQVPDPTWVPATISHSTIKVVCGSTTSPSATGTNGPATIIFDGSNLVNSVTVTASTGFLVSTNKTDANTYKQTITINPIASGDHEGTLDNIYIIASTSKETSEDYAGTITLEGEDITDGSQEISVTADVTCLPYTLTFNDRGSTIPATYYAGALVPEPTPPTDVCTDPINYEFDGWAMAIVEDGSVEYTKVDFSTFTMPANNNTILYAVYRYAEESTDDVCDENQFKIVRTQNELESGADYILAGYNGTYDYAMTKTIRKYTNSYYDVLTSIKNSEYINDDYIITLDNDEEEDFVWKITGDLTNGYQIYDEYSNKYLTLGEWYLKNTSPREYFTRFDWEDTGTKFRININEEKNGAAYISYTNNYTWYFGLMYYIDEPDQHIIRGTTTETYIYLYKRCSGIKYLYTTTPDCDSDCTPATDITYTTEGTSITLSWTATEPSATIILYADKNATSPVKEINNATSPYTINGLAETTTYYAQIVTNEDCTSAITEVSTERPYVEIVEWDTDHLNAYINTNEDITITLENEVQKGTPTSRVATELFFSKYFEATGNVKLLALYNGTEKAIDLTSYKIKLSVLGASSLTDKNESTDIDYAQTINLGTDIPAEKRTLPAGKELILIAYANSGADDAVIFMNPDGTQSTIDKNDAAILTCAANSTTSGWNEYIRISTGKLNFSGNDAVALFKGETLIDIIGAGDATDADVQNLSPKTDFMDAPGWYNTEGYQIQPDGTIGATKNYALSTNRCLLIRRNSVTSGYDAVTKNETNFATLGGENCEWMGYQIPDKASACEGFEYVGGYDFSSYYSSYEKLSSDYYSPATRNSDGTYTVNVNLTPHACKRLMITIKNHTTQQVMAVQEYKVPIIIDTDHTTTGKKFTDLKNNLGTIIVDQNGTPTGDITPLTDEEWKAACKECDVVVRDNATLSHKSGGINQFRDMTIYPTGKLDNGNSQAITLNSLQMQSMNNEIPYAIINNDGSTIDVGNMVFIKRMDDKYWYQFSLPYDCKISDIRQLNGQSMGKYWVDWGIKEYNGKRRQTEGTAATEGQVSQYWEKVEENATLKAHQGYIIGLFTHKWASVYFTPSTTNPYRESGNDAKTTTVESWYTTNLATLAPRHHGWNFTGSPYITQFGQANAGQGMNNTLLMRGEINQESIDQEYINTENVYVTIPDLPDGLTYTQAIASTTTIKPFTAYFVQTIDVTGNSDATRTLTYDKTGRSLPSSAPARAAATKQRVLVELNITAPDGQTDNTGIWVDERYTTDYEIAADLTKMYVAGTKPQLYTIAVDNEKLAYNALPDNAAAYIPLGLYAPVAGDYTLTLDERVSRVAGAETVELLYNNQLVANLLYQDYTITANKGTVSGYSLSIRRRADVSTAVDNTTGSTITLIANDEYISLVGVPTDATISIYDMLGRLISSQQANGQSVVNMPIVPQGVYNIVVANGTGYTTIKSVIK